MSAPPPPDFSDLLGPQLIGLLVNFCLFGVLTVQTYIYRLSFPNDKLRFRLFVAFVYVYEFVSTIMNGIDAFNWFAKGFGDLAAGLSPGLSPIYSPMGEGIIAAVVQLFFCYRIWSIEPRALVLSIFIACLALLSGAGGFAAGVTGEISANSFENGAALKAAQKSLWIWLVSGAVTDILVAVTMSILLLRRRSTTSQRSNDMIERIVQMTVETNAATAIVAIVSIAVFAGYPGKTYFLCPSMFLGRLYTNTLLLTFNNRAFEETRRNTSYHSSARSRVTTNHDIETTGSGTTGYTGTAGKKVHVNVAKEVTFEPKGYGGGFTPNRASGFNEPADNAYEMKSTWTAAV
ncbi:hypothetical protein C8J56DRAFT_135715 [Mycena floridula]|nr:hypothetical protein C8J56DRAFT_135715 [Mycena floridula]